MFLLKRQLHLQSRCFARLTATAQHNHCLRAMPAQEHLDTFKATIPVLDGNNYKGQHGKLGVVGGCAFYTGAPFFAANTALQAGADMVYVICTPEASPVIKSYSPDMMVLPFLPGTDEGLSAVRSRMDAVETWLKRMSVLVVGPGLGEDPGPQEMAAHIIRWARQQQLPIVIDGSGITTIAKDPSLIRGYNRCIITPNIAELGRLADAFGVPVVPPIGNHWQESSARIAQAMDGPILISKGPKDIITDGHTSIVCDEPGGLKRCGGIGDVLAGAMGTFLGWQYDKSTQAAAASGGASSTEPSQDKLMAAAYCACLLLRKSGFRAFQGHGRATSAQHIMAHIPDTFTATFEAS